MRRSSRHAEVNDPLGLGREVERVHRAAPPLFSRGPGDAPRIEQRRKRERSDAGSGPA